MDRIAVSPVVGTIILVAITVVTASMLYFVTAGLLPNPTSTAPNIILYPASATSVAGQYRLQLSSVSYRFPLSDFQAQIINISNNLKIAPTAIDLKAGSTLIQGAGINLTFTDIDRDGTLSAGDYFLLQGVRPGQRYLVAVLWKASGNVIDGWTAPLS